MRCLFALTLAACTAAPAMARDERPMSGILFSERENHSLTYRCNPGPGDTLSCEFVQMSVRKKKSAEDAEKDLQEARAELRRSGQLLGPQECKQLQETLDVLEGRRPAPRPADLARMTTTQKADSSAMLKAALYACRTRSESDVIAAFRLMLAKEHRTCTVSSNSFSQTFKRISGAGAAWLAQGTPQGVCGDLQISRFEYEPPSDPQGIGFWNYVSRRAITNPNAVAFPGPKPTMCSSFDQSETAYTWRQRELQLGCDYIEFTVL